MPLYTSITHLDSSNDNHKAVFEERQHGRATANNEMFDRIRLEKIKTQEQSIHLCNGNMSHKAIKEWKQTISVYLQGKCKHISCYV